MNYPIALKFDRHLSSTAAEVSVKFQDDHTILNTNLTALRHCEILHVNKMSYWILKKGLGLFAPYGVITGPNAALAILIMTICSGRSCLAVQHQAIIHIP